MIGAGPAGLACAITLERLGIRPDIFEKHDHVGYPVPMVEVLHGISHPRLGISFSFCKKSMGLLSSRWPGWRESYTTATVCGRRSPGNAATWFCAAGTKGLSSGNWPTN